MWRASKLAKIRLREQLCGVPFVDNEFNRDSAERVKTNSLMREACMEIQRDTRGKIGIMVQKQIQDFLKI